ncbi:OmpA family protein [Moritella sp. 5]|uniref:OmpA family protein n=1 Tax=Moritella sp. 5 TaxID=2746231 RepID=UPI001BA67DC2|nr:OmpA family protein [Moritella sp. 5]
MNRGMPIRKTSEVDDSGAWLSIGDLMSGLLMIFALLLISALVQISDVNEKSQNNRVIIIKGINNSLASAGIDVQADPETGDISILDSVLFGHDDYKLKQSGKDFLNSFVPLYGDVIFQSVEVSEEVVRIVIEGHTSKEGSFNYNMKLSLLRANSVSEYIRSMRFQDKPAFFDKVLISGRGPLDANINKVSAEDRKVKFRLQFKGQQFLTSLGTEVTSVE